MRSSAFDFFAFAVFPPSADAGNLDPRQLPAMANGPVITFATTILERDDFLVLPLLDHFTGDGRAFDKRIAMRELLGVTVKQDITENSFLACFAFEQIHIDNVALGDAMLSTACFDNCVSHNKRHFSGEKPRKLTRVGRFDKGKAAAAAVSGGKVFGTLRQEESPAGEFCAAVAASLCDAPVSHSETATTRRSRR